MADELRLAIVGVGNISAIYIKMLGQLPGVRLVGLADAIEGRAEKVAAGLEGVRAMSVREAVADADDVDAVVNLTIPTAHVQVSCDAIAGGRHVYTEKPLAANTVDGAKVIEAANAAGVRVGCAPDTVLGTGIQTAREVIDAGRIGAPVAATAFFTARGPDNWHPNPDFFYQPGGGPLLDVGPYYVASLIQLLGPVARVVSMARPSFIERPITSGPNEGHVIKVDVDTHVSATLEHESGVLSTLIASFDIQKARLPRVEIYGADGTVDVPDPNTFGGDVDVFLPGKDWETVSPSAGIRDAQRGIGVADMARALRHGEPHRASGEVGYHGLDVMETILAAAVAQKSLPVKSTCDRPALMPLGGFDYFAS
jgi:predicted dehydrogenase